MEGAYWGLCVVGLGGGPCIEDPLVGVNQQWDGCMEGAESCLWGMALNSEGESFVGPIKTGVLEP